MAFRLLRVNGYDVSPGKFTIIMTWYLWFNLFQSQVSNQFFSVVDPLTRFSEELGFFNSFEVCVKDIGSALELFRASEIIIHPAESVLEKLNLLTRQFLKQELSNNSIQANISQEVVNYWLFLV